MALSEIVKIDQIEIVETGSIQIRTATIIEKDGVEISRTFHRHVVHPNEDISKEDEKVQAIAKVVWTDEVIEAYKKLIEKKEDIL